MVCACTILLCIVIVLYLVFFLAFLSVPVLLQRN